MLWCMVVLGILSVGRGPQKTQFLSHFRDFLFPETNFSFNSRYFGLQLSSFRPVLIYDMHGRKFHQPCSGLLCLDHEKRHWGPMHNIAMLHISKTSNGLQFFAITKNPISVHFEMLITDELDLLSLLDTGFLRE